MVLSAVTSVAPDLGAAIVRDVLVVSPDTAVLAAIAKMSQAAAAPVVAPALTGSLTEVWVENIAGETASAADCIVVVADDRVVGLLTETDVVRLIAQQQPLDHLVMEQVMTAPVVTLSESDFTNAAIALKLLQQHHHRHLLILDEQDQLAGLVTAEQLRRLELTQRLLRSQQQETVMMETRLRTQEAQSRAILKAIPDYMVRVGADGVYREVVTENRTNDLVPPDLDPVGSDMTDILPPEVVSQHQHYLQEALCTGETQVYEQQIYFSGDLRDEEVRVIKSGDDEVLFMIRDITDRKRAEVALKQSEQTNRTIIEILPDLLIQMDRQGYYNRLVGGQTVHVKYPTAQSTEPDIYTVLSPDLAKQRLDYTHRALESGQLQVYEQVFDFDDDTRHEEVRIAPLSDQEVLIIVRDITERKQAEIKIRESEQRYMSLAAAAPVGIFRTDAAGDCTYVNDRWCQIAGLTPETAVGQGWRQGLHPEDRDRITAEWYQAVQENRPFQLEYRFQRPNGTVTWVYGQSVAERDAEGQVTGYVGTVTNISDLKRSEAALQESERRFRTLFEATPTIAVQGYNHHRQVIYWNQASEQLYGYTPAEAVGHTLEDLIIPTNLQAWVVKSVDSWLAGGPAIPAGELKLKRKDGSEVPVFSSHIMLENSVGEPEMYCVDIDLSALKQAEQDRQQLVQQLSDFKFALDQSAIVATTDAKGVITYVNDYFCDISGYSQDELIGHTHRLVNSGYHPPSFFQNMWRTITQGKIWQGEICNRAKDGHLYWVASTFVPFLDAQGRPFQYLAIRFDITDRKQVEQRLQQLNQTLEDRVAERTADLRQREQFIQTVLDTIPLPVFWKDRSSVFLGCNQRFAQAMGVQSSAELLGKTDAEFATTQANADAYQSDDRWVMKSGRAKLGIEETIESPAGEMRWLETHKAPLRGLDDDIIGTVGAFRDITERKQAELALIQSNAKNRAMLDAIPDLMFRVGADGTYREFVKGRSEFESFFDGRDPIGLPMAELVPVEISTSKLEAMAEVLRTNTLQVYEQQLQLDDQIRYEEVRVVKSGEDEVLFMIRDISERKRLDAERKQTAMALYAKTEELQQSYQHLKETQFQLVQSEKMASLGQLVAGIAHEINNPVSFIYGNLVPALDYVTSLTQLIRLYQANYVDPPPAITEFIQGADIEYIFNDFPKLLASMKTGANRIQAIVQSLRTFSHLDQVERKAVNLHDNLDNTLVILQNRLNGRAGNPSIDVVKQYGDLPLVECYGGLLNQVFMNLLANAIDAIEEHQTAASPHHSGCITITTAVVSDDKVSVSIKDNGSGMPPETQAKIFNPFFTTKPPGVGTGMGLSISYQIVTGDHQGQLSCRSVLGGGTEFVLELWQRIPSETAES